MIKNYPRALYPSGDPEQPSVVVEDESQEATKRAEGYCSVGEIAQEKAPEKRKPGRPKAE